MEKKTKIFKRENLKLWSMVIFMCFPAFYEILNGIIGSTSLARMLLIFMCYAPIVFIFLFRKEPVRKIYIVLPILVAAAMSFYSLINVDSRFMLESWALPSSITFFSGIVGFYMIVIQDNAQMTKKAFKLITVILFIYYMWYTSDIQNAATYSWGYDMFLGYRMLIVNVFSLYFALDSEKIKPYIRLFWLALFSVSLYIILVYGSRGPLVGIALFFVMRYSTLFINRKDVSLTRKIIVTGLLILLFCVMLLNLESMIKLLAGHLDVSGLSSRTLNRFLQSTIVSDNGRIALMERALSMVNIIGHGPYADQYYFGEGQYCHNFIVEILFDFGYIMGILILCLIAYCLIKVFCNAAKNGWYDLFMVFFCYCAGRLMFSGTFWTETNFWIMCALGYLCIKNRNNTGEDYESGSENRGQAAKRRTVKNTENNI